MPGLGNVVSALVLVTAVVFASPGKEVSPLHNVEMENAFLEERQTCVWETWTVS